MAVQRTRPDKMRVLDPFRFVLIAVAGWMNQRHLQMIDYLREENRVLREQLGASPRWADTGPSRLRRAAPRPRRTVEQN